MFWLNLKPKLLILLSWLGHHWYVPLLLVVALAALLSGSRNVVKWGDVIKGINDSHKKEVDVIQASHEAELQKYNAAVRRMDDAREAVKAEYERNQRELDKGKQKEIERILEKTKHDPIAMQAELERSTGMHVIIVS